MTLLSDIYDVVPIRRGLRGKAAKNIVRPTIKQFFTSEVFEDITAAQPILMGRTSDLCEGGVIASSHNSPTFNDRTPDKCFDNTLATYWDTYETDTDLCWISYDFGEGNEKTIEQYTIAVYSIGQFAPTDWVFKGSNDNVVWDDLDTKSDYVWTANPQIFTFSNQNAYRYYKLDISKSNTDNRTILTEIQMMENIYSTPGSNAKEFKSVILDFADGYDMTLGTNYGGMGIRSVDFNLQGNTHTITQDNMSAYHSNVFSSYYSWKAFDSTLSKIGTHEPSWLADDYQDTNQRIIVVFDNPLVFDEIVINNFHSFGYNLIEHGVKNTKITATTDVYSDTTYNATVPNSEVLFDGIIPKHSEEDAVDNYSIPL